MRWGRRRSSSSASSVEVFAASAGYADKDWNSFYFGGDQDSAPVDGNVSLSIPISVCENATLTPGVQYTMLLDNDIEDGAEGIYFDTEQVIGSIKASYVF